MTFTVSAVAIPILITLFLLAVACRPYRASGYMDLTLLFRAFWIVPILLVWVIYFAIVAYHR